MTLQARAPIPADDDGRDGDTAEANAPHPLQRLDRDAGLSWRVFITRLGAVSARVSPARTSETATVLLHGAAGSWSTWTPLLTEARSRGLEPADLVLIDLPGWGDSMLHPDLLARPTDAGLVEEYSRTVVEVLRSLGYRDWHVVGHSMGALIALDLAAVEPVATLSAGLVSPSSFAVADAARHPFSHLLRRPAFVGLHAVMRAFSAHGDAASAFLRRLNRMGLLRRVVSPLFARPQLVHDSVVAALAREVRPAAFVLAARLAALYDFDGSLARIRCPVRSVRGEHDVFATADDDARLARLIADYRSTVLPSAGHFGQIEAPAAVLTALGSAFSPRS